MSEMQDANIGGASVEAQMPHNPVLVNACACAYTK
jgi:hypothetical protein